MAENIEIKARLPDVKAFDHIHTLMKLRNKTEGDKLMQTDTFYYTTQGRLKLREQTGAKSFSELIFYERPDTTGPKHCKFTTTPVLDPNSMKEILKKTLKCKGVVVKERLLFMIDKTRVHIDIVQGLGYFAELEVCMSPGQTREEGVAIADGLMLELKIDPHWLQSGAYIDLLEAKQDGVWS